MAATEMLRARVDKDLARHVERWAKEHDTDVSGTIRIALHRLLEQTDRWKAAEEAVRQMREDAKLGIFDPPKGPWKAGGFR